MLQFQRQGMGPRRPTGHSAAGAMVLQPVQPVFLTAEFVQGGHGIMGALHITPVCNCHANSMFEIRCFSERRNPLAIM